MRKYIHGYSREESTRLNDQADAVAQFIHYDSTWPEGSTILEAGCGVGAQTKTIASLNAKSNFISIDLSESSVGEAKNRIAEQGITNVDFQEADIYDLPFENASFDHVFICFVLEHLKDIKAALAEAKRVLKPGGSVMVIEGDHGSTYFHPDSLEARKAVQCQVRLQQQKGGDANIGRRLYPLLFENGFKKISVSPRQIYVDDSMPDLVEGFTKNTFTAMIKGIEQEAIESGLISASEMQKGIEDLLKTAQGGGTFCYTFFKATAKKLN